MVAGDTFADALAAASLSDPLDRGDQPVLRRVAAADPVFDPIGRTDRAETAFAPIITTASARAGARSLSAAARISAEDLARGGCTTAREAVIVGGASAVPIGVEQQLLDLGYREVFRVGGVDRYDTAASVARALGTEALPPGTTCRDPDTLDGTARLGFYANAAPEYRYDAQSCVVLSRAVVLADGTTGADALAAAWWTSRWQVPVLLTDERGSLPPATKAALRDLDVDTVVVLGGTARIPEQTVDEAKALAGAVAGRIAGGDRYGTSVEMASAFGGWFPLGDGADFAGDRLCVVASSGSGPAAAGWSDALAMGAWCGRLAAAGRPSPVRALPNARGGPNGVQLTGGTTPAHDAAPVFLVPVGAARLPEPLSRFLTESFDPAAAWCHADHTDAGCVAPGFAIVAGGESSVTVAAVNELTDLVSGGFGGDRTELAPSWSGEFVTDLDLSAVHGDLGGRGRRLCLPHGGLRGVRWVSFRAGDHAERFLGESDVVVRGAYRTEGSSRALCALAQESAGATALGTSSTGSTTGPIRIPDMAVAPVRTDAVVQQRVEVGPGGTSLAASGLRSPVRLLVDGAPMAITDATLTLDLRSRVDGSSAASGIVTLATASGPVELRVVGEVTPAGGERTVAGRVVVSAGGRQWRGGFVLEADAATGDVRWTFDGFDVLPER